MNGYKEQAEAIVNSGLYDAAVELMDDEIREKIHAEKAPCDEVTFLEEYMRAHLEKYGEDFVIN